MLYLWRGWRSLTGRSVPRGGLLGALPHLIDTVLFASAIALMFFIRQFPIANDWLTLKVGGLVAYIVLGSIAVRSRASRPVRVSAFIGSLLCVSYMVATALHHDGNPLDW